MELSIIIPVYNEATVITKTLDRIAAIKLPSYVRSAEIIVVDDCSTDNSASTVRGYHSNDCMIRIIILNENMGKGGAVAAGIKAASGDTVIVQDADLELDPADIPKLIERLHSDNLDIAGGSRFREKIIYPLYSMPAVVANIIYSKLASLLTSRKISDLTCGYKIFRKDLADRIDLNEKGFGFETELMMKSLTDGKIKYGEVDVSYNPRKRSEGKKIRISDGLYIMGKIMKYGTSGRNAVSKITVATIIAIMLFNLINVKHWKDEKRVIEWDAISYYAYLPATFIYHDLSLGFIDGYSGDHKFVFWPEKSPTGKYVIKTTMGMSFLWIPFFGTGHLIAKITGADDGGFSAPYKLMLLLSTLTYFFIGLLYLRKILLSFCSDGVASITLAGFAFATNIYWYTLFQSTMAHVPGFALISAFTWYSMQWHKSQSEGNRRKIIRLTIAVGLLLGLISLIRPTNAIIVIVFLLYGVTTTASLKERAGIMLKEYRLLILVSLMACIIWIPQLIYWKEMTGNYLYFSYGSDEHFFFNHPVILRGLFGFRKGLFIYTPLLIFSFAGLITLWKKSSPFALAITCFIPVNIYIIFSWWCWWYGGGFGQRAFIDSYALMAVPTAALLQYAFENRRRYGGTVILTAFILLASLGIFNNIQYYYGAIHWDSMTSKAYFNSFGRIHPSKQFQNLLKYPDYEAARKGDNR